MHRNKHTDGTAFFNRDLKPTFKRTSFKICFCILISLGHRLHIPFLLQSSSFVVVVNLCVILFVVLFRCLPDMWLRISSDSQKLAKHQLW
ncbi:hypothetical protein Hdeb2414_s0008g00272101 [Helianthus debilis subsp. tardiflorus]